MKDLGKCQHDQRKKRTAEAVPKAEKADKQADGNGNGTSKENADPGAKTEMQKQHGGGVGAQPEKKSMPEGELADIAPQHVPPLAHDGEYEYHDHGVRDMRGNRPRQDMQSD